MIPLLTALVVVVVLLILVLAVVVFAKNKAAFPAFKNKAAFPAFISIRSDRIFGLLLTSNLKRRLGDVWVILVVINENYGATSYSKLLI